MDQLFRTERTRHFRLTGRLLRKNALYNLAGQVLPLIAALYAIPVIVAGLGVEKFGILTIAWLVVGYFTLFDMGIGRATTKFVSETLALGRSEELPVLIWSSLLLLLSLGFLGGAIIAVLARWLVTSLLAVPAAFHRETVLTFYFLALSIPFILASSGARGILEAQQRFALVNAVKIPAGIATFIIPVLVLPFSRELHVVIGFLVLSRVLFFLIYLIASMGSIEGLSRPRMPSVSACRQLIGFGGWMTVSNIISPLMTYMDRLFIGTFLTMTYVAYYATPYDLVTKIWIISGSIMGVVFPLLTASIAADRDNLHALHERVFLYLVLVLTPAAMVLIVLANPLLAFWLGPDFAANSTTVMQVLTIGTVICGMAQLPFGLLQAAGRPDLTAKIHMAELPFYLVLIWYLIPAYSISGAAIAWGVRVTVDAILLFATSHAIVQTPMRLRVRHYMVLASVAFGLVITAFVSRLTGAPVSKIILVALILAISGAAMWSLSKRMRSRDA